MKYLFYDRTLKTKVEAEVTEKNTYGDPERPRFGIKAKKADGKTYSTFVSKAVYDSIIIGK